MPTLSKSRFVSGMQCEKKLFFDVNRRDLKPPVTEQQQKLFDTGHALGILAQQVFAEGKDATESMNGQWNIAIDKTKKWLNEGISTVYEATFSCPGGFAALDILHHTNGERWAIEVKSSTSVKEYHITDASFQYFVMKNAGFAPDKFFLMHINNQYVKNGAINPTQLFHLEDITQLVLDNQERVMQKQKELLSILSKATEPVIEIGPHCSAPFSCDYMAHCWKHLPENNVFNLGNARGKEWELYKQGILSLNDVPEDFPLDHRQSLQVKGIKLNEQYIDQPKIDEFLSGINGPLYFFDFETIFTAIPILNGTSPFEQTPFQYSLHITDINGAITAHKYFLANPDDFTNPNAVDPRLQLIRQLQKDISPHGAIIAYNASFEINILRKLADAFEQERAFLEGLISRFIDLLTPFRNAFYYKPEMGSSASIKSVLPAIAPEFSYKDLEIGNGGDASNIYHALITGTITDPNKTIYNNLLKYCERDSEGMVVIYRHLKAITP